MREQGGVLPAKRVGGEIPIWASHLADSCNSIRSRTGRHNPASLAAKAVTCSPLVHVALPRRAAEARRCWAASSHPWPTFTVPEEGCIVLGDGKVKVDASASPWQCQERPPGSQNRRPPGWSGRRAHGRAHSRWKSMHGRQDFSSRQMHFPFADTDGRCLNLSYNGACRA